MEKVTYEIQNLKCGGCANQIKKQLGKLHEISNLEVSEEGGTVSFTYENIYILMEVKNILKRLGYPISTTENTLLDKAKSYVSCAVGRFGNVELKTDK